MPGGGKRRSAGVANALGATHDVIVIGGGPAGLSAALMLGRCRRSVLVIDAGQPRNRWSREIHGFLTRDGVAPLELLRLGREELVRYGVEFHAGIATDARCLPAGGFRVRLQNGAWHRSRKLVLATGVCDRLPPIPNFERFYGVSVHHCPYCDGWEWRDAPLAAYGRGRKGVALALSLRTWARDVAVCTDGPARLGAEERAKLTRFGIPLHERRISSLEGSKDGRLERVVFDDGTVLSRRALFFNTGQSQSCDLAVRLGCRLDPKGEILTDRRERTGVPGLFLVGDASKDVQFAIVAAAEGATAAVAINTELQDEAGRRLRARTSATYRTHGNRP